MPTRAEEPPSHATITPREQRLWQRIVTLDQSTPATQPYEAWFEAVRQRRRALLGRVRLYLTLYPGGAYRDQAIRLELAALFELGTLRGETLDRLCERVDEILRDPPSDAAVREAAYWAILCGRRGDTGTTAPVRVPDAELLDACRGYVETYPRSRYVPRLASLLFDDAARRGDREAMQRTVARLREHFPNHAVTAALEARYRRAATVGQPFWPTSLTVDGRPLGQREYLGHPVLILVWAGFDESARRCAQSVEHFRAAHPEVRVIGVSLDESTQRSAAVSRELGIEWPQCNDGLGWGGAFVRRWGVCRIPHVFVIDRAGRLVGSVAGNGWEALARKALGAGRKPSGSADGARARERDASGTHRPVSDAPRAD